MIKTSNVIKKIKKYKNIIEAKFYDECLTKLNKLKKINKIPENKHILESFKLFFLDTNSNYNIYISNNKPTKKRLIYREIEGTKKITNLLRQINAIEYNNINSIGLKVEQSNRLYLVISDKDLDLKKIKEKDKCLNLLLGVESLDVASHQDLDRMVKFLGSNSDEIQKSFKIFNLFKSFYQKLNREQKMRTILFSGSILQTLGTTYTRDIDLIYYGEGQNINEINKIKSLFDSENYIDYHIIHNKNVIKRDKSLDYLYRWIVIDWPKMVGVQNIREVIVDPMYHYHFMGIKLLGVKMTIERLISRAAPTSFVDLIMLNRVNGYPSQPCFPNLTLRQGNITIYTDKKIKKKLYTIQNYFRKWHNINLSMRILMKKIPRCSSIPGYYYKKKSIMNPNSDKLLKILSKIKSNYRDKYSDSIFFDINNEKINIESMSNKKIILFGLNHNKIQNKIKHNGRFEIYTGQEPLFGIYRFLLNGINKYLFYLNGVYDQGKILNIVDENNLIKTLKIKGYNVLRDDLIINLIPNNLKKKLISILSVYRIVVLA